MAARQETCQKKDSASPLVRDVWEGPLDGGGLGDASRKPLPGELAQSGLELADHSRSGSGTSLAFGSLRGGLQGQRPRK